LIHCLVVICLVANPTECKTPVEIIPADSVITSPMQCERGGLIYFSQFRMARQTPDGEKPLWFPKVRAKMDGNGDDIVATWLADQRAKRAAARPQIR
jgi:hypothetical protein